MEPHSRHQSLGRPEADACGEMDAFGILHLCHQHITERLERLESVARSLQEEATFTEHHLAELGDVITFLDAAIPIHTADEEHTLFPLMRRHPDFATAAATPMDCMEMQHRVHSDMRRALDVAIVHRDAPATSRAAMRMVVDYRDHMAKEEEILYPLARRLLADEKVIAWMTEEMRARRRAAGLLDC